MNWINPGPLSGLALYLLTAGSIAALIYGMRCRGEKRRTVLTGVIFGAVAFQIFHVFEHALQLGYWMLNPHTKPWLTPWAETGVNGLAYWCQILPGKGATTNRGVEVLHLVGNTLFMSGVIAMVVLAAAAKVRSRATTGTLIFQGFHLAEHVLLTATLFIGGTGWGASTLFGTLGGSQLSTHRVWWHFTVNAVATVAGLLAVRSLYRAGALAIKPSLARDTRTSSTPQFIGAMAGAMALLIALPLALGFSIGKPALPMARNFAMSDLIDPGLWWHLANPYILLPLASLLYLISWMRRTNSLASTAHQNI